MFTGTLYPFQEEARERMVDRGQMLLAFYMGLGKTPTTIATCETLIEEGEVDRVLCIVPSSLKFQWLREIRKFTNSRAIVIDGAPASRSVMWRHARRCQYVIINSELLLSDMATVMKFPYQCVVVDEATIIKSPRAKRSKAVKKIGRKVQYRFALSGQPIENRPEELFSIMEFVDPEVLGNPALFDRTFIVRDHWGKVKRYRNLPTLHERMTDVMVRKTRNDVKDQLPQIVTQVVPVEFDKKGATLYRKIAADLLRVLNEAMSSYGKGFDVFAHYSGEDDSANQARGDIMSRLTVLRMLCDNPRIVERSAERFAQDDEDGGSEYAFDITEKGLMEGVVKTPKLDATVELIEEILAEDPRNKVVLFSFFRDNLREIGKATAHLTNHVMFMGGMNAKERDNSKMKFANDPNTRLFLSSDAGGYGVDLPMANYLISYDLPWSAGKIDQREARIVRLSSDFPEVTLISMVMKGSIEQRQHEMLEQKRGIGTAVIDGKYDAKGTFELNLGSLTEFLRESEV